MKRSVQYIAYIIPFLFAVICLAWFCKVNSCSDYALQKADYAKQGTLIIKSESSALPSTYSLPHLLPSLDK